MPSPSLLPVVPIIIVALATVTICDVFIKLQPRQGGYQPLDGLRGFMALFVFLHHSGIYYEAISMNLAWAIPTSNVYEQFGPTSVFMFFMITAFLFYAKLMAYKDKPFDWRKFYIGRFLRIYPLYVPVMIAFFIVVGIVSDWTLREPLFDVIIQGLKWMMFMVPDVNRIQYTSFIVAGVVWSLTYEWMFYCFLPFIGLLLNIRVSTLTLIISGICCFIFLQTGIVQEPERILRINSPFLVGILAVYAYKNEKLRHIASSKIVSIILIPLIIFSYTYFHTVFSIVPYFCMSITFIAVACGNSLFGLLTCYPARLLGQISYSIYLIHGICLYITFHLILGSTSLPSEFWFWQVIAILTIAFITLCSFTYKYIEEPFINMTPRVAASKKSVPVHS